MFYNFSKLPSGVRLCRILNADKIKRKSTEVDTNLLDQIKETIWKMVRACVVDGGIGLAAPQIGIYKQLFIAQETDGVFRAYINPSFSAVLGTGRESALESCLSVPGKSLVVSRFSEIAASWTEITEDGTLDLHEEILKGFQARVFQHELDHLSAITIIDRVKQAKN